VAARLDTRRERLPEHVRLRGRGHLDEGVDPALAPDEALRFEAERQDHRNLALGRAIRCLSGRVIGHNMTRVINRRALVRTPGAGTM
jgi:hypothetical protein